ncbi:hypothetical protein [Maribellus sediminis]|uniref:hypothetical protein n=1 Tax=Maribellus sediminis TaxID=2696285 RepID=UPI001430C1FF|nr:hypothetical protein [Maribellus sediminis]
MKNLSLILSLVLIFGISIVANAQKTANHNVKVGISKHALVGVSSASEIVLEPAAPTVAGEGLNFDAESTSDNSVYLQYSSIIGSSANKITVAMDGDNLPTGVSIELTATDDAGAGNGAVGKAVKGAITLSGTSEDIVTNIKNCYTGTGAGSGHQLTYTLKMGSDAKYEDLTSGNFTNTVTYTITEN